MDIITYFYKYIKTLNKYFHLKKIMLYFKKKGGIMIRALVFINLKMIFIDKISFLWTILFPVLMLFLNRENIDSIYDISIWQLYIVITSLLFGIGIQALKNRENGLVKYFYSMEKNNVKYFIALFVIQTIYIAICMFIFSIIASLLFKFSLTQMFLSSVKVYLIALPIALIGCNITLIKNVHVNSLNTIATIIVFLCVMLANYNIGFNVINPIYQIYKIFIYGLKDISIIFIIAYILFSIMGVYAIKTFDYKSMEIR